MNLRNMKKNTELYNFIRPPHRAFRQEHTEVKVHTDTQNFVCLENSTWPDKKVTSSFKQERLRSYHKIS